MDVIAEFNAKIDTGEEVTVAVFPDRVEWEEEDAGDGAALSGVFPLAEVSEVAVTKKLFRTALVVAGPAVTLQVAGKPGELQQLADRVNAGVEEAKKWAHAEAVKRQREVSALLSKLRGLNPNERLLALGEYHRQGLLGDKEYADAQVRALGL